MQVLENRVIFYKEPCLKMYKAGSGIRLYLDLKYDLLGFNFT